MSERTTSLCEIAWLGRSRLAQEEHLLRLQRHTSKALRSARLSLSREEPAPRAEAEIGTIIRSCANAWRAEFADLSIAMTETRTCSGSRSEQEGKHLSSTTTFMGNPSSSAGRSSVSFVLGEAAFTPPRCHPRITSQAEAELRIKCKRRWRGGKPVRP